MNGSCAIFQDTLFRFFSSSNILSMTEAWIGMIDGKSKGVVVKKRK